MRDTESIPPPGGWDAISRMVFAGYACCCAQSGPAAASNTAAATARAPEVGIRKPVATPAAARATNRFGHSPIDMPAPPFPELLSRGLHELDGSRENVHIVRIIGGVLVVELHPFPGAGHALGLKREYILIGELQVRGNGRR